MIGTYAFNGAKRAALTAALLMAFAAPVSAQQPTAGALATAKEIVAIKGASNLFGAIIPSVVEQAKALFLQSNPMLGKDLNETAAALRKDLEPRQVELSNEVARLYATHFSEAELKEVLAFYKTAVGKKMIEQEPRALEQSMQFAQSWRNKFSEEVIGKMRAEMKKKGHNI
ncbi:MAG: DUF2059 domain-containing protein [Hyphomicrobiales bacterium]